MFSISVFQLTYFQTSSIFLLFQASSDLSILDLDLPFCVIFTVSAVIELLTTFGIMAS